MQLFPWLVPTFNQITQSFDNQKGHHALLLKSPPNIGILNLVDFLTARILCSGVNKPCFKCKNCNLFKHNTHPDLLIIKPEINSDNIKKEIGINAIREIHNKAQTTAHQDGNVVIQIQDADKLNLNAINALLKILEEPPENYYFILNIENNKNIIATINSRCQTWQINPKADLITNWLKQQFPDASTQQLQIALDLCNQQPLKTSDFFATGKLTERQLFVMQFMKLLNKNNLLQLLRLFANERLLIIEQLNWLMVCFMDLLKIKLQLGNITNQDLSNFYQEMDNFDKITIIQIINLIQQNLHNLQQNNNNILLNADLVLASFLANLILKINA